MALKVRLHFLSEESNQPQYVSPLAVAHDDTFATLKIFIENKGLVDFEFDF